MIDPKRTRSAGVTVMEIPLRITDNRTKSNLQKLFFGLFRQVVSTRFSSGKRPSRRRPMNDTMRLSQRADALEETMSRELDYIVIKSRLYSMAEGDMGPAPNAAALMKANPKARV